MGKKRQSKRMTLHKKHKIEKKVREHHRKVRRANKQKLKSTGGLGVRKVKAKDPGIPSLYPFKAQILEDLERRKVEAKQKKAERAKLRREGNDCGEGEINDMEELARDVQKRHEEFEDDIEEEEEEIPKLVEDAGLAREGSRKAFMTIFRQVVESADVILEVLDARDPLGCRCHDAERRILRDHGGKKRLVLVLNKIDMIPKESANRWLSYLRNDFPTTAFRSSTQKGSRKDHGSVSALEASSVGSSECLGAANLISLLKNYSRSHNMKTAICVGVIGYPNVGKSSLINSLKRSRAVTVGPTPGVTRALQEVHLDKSIRLIDCPGIVFSEKNSYSLVLRNCIKIEQLEDVIGPVETIVKRVGREPLMIAYSLPEFSSVSEFLALVAKMRGKFKRGGAFDLEAAAKIVLGDWISGKIPFYTLPPKGPRTAQLSANVVSQWAQEFELGKIVKKEEAELKATTDLSPEARAQAVCAKDVAMGDDEDTMDGKDGEGWESIAESELEGMEEDDMVADEVRQEEQADTEPSFHVAAKPLRKKKAVSAG